MLFGLNAVDELGRYAFGVLLPNIRDEFGLSTQGILTVVAFGFVGALILALPIGFWADRFNRVRIIVIAGILLFTFSILTAIAVTVVMLAIARAGSELGRGFNDPVHNSLIRRLLRHPRAAEGVCRPPVRQLRRPSTSGR